MDAKHRAENQSRFSLRGRCEERRTTRSRIIAPTHAGEESYFRGAKGNSTFRRTVAILRWCVTVVFATCVAQVTAIDIIQEVAADSAKEQMQARQMFPDNILDQWVFQGRTKFSDARGILQAKLDLKVAFLEATSSVNLRQQEKLHLAGLGDIQGFLRDCEKLQREVDPTDQQQVAQIWQRVQPLRTRFHSGLFGRNSFLERVLQQCLTEAQLQDFLKRQRETRQFDLETSIRRFVVQVDLLIPFTPEGRGELTRLLIKHVPPPLELETQQQQNMIHYFVLYFANSVPKEELQACFDEEGWQTFSKPLATGKRMEASLKAQGMIE